MNLTGRQPKPQITEDCPNTYLQGLEFAIQDEQNSRFLFGNFR